MIPSNAGPTSPWRTRRSIGSPKVPLGKGWSTTIAYFEQLLQRL